MQWGEVLLEFGTGGAPADGDSSPVLDGNTAYFKVLSKVSKLTQIGVTLFIFYCFVLISFQDETSYSISDLKEATKYLAKVQAITRGGEGLVAFVTFDTPMVSYKQTCKYRKRLVLK